MWREPSTAAAFTQFEAWVQSEVTRRDSLTASASAAASTAAASSAADVAASASGSPSISTAGAADHHAAVRDPAPRTVLHHSHPLWPVTVATAHWCDICREKTSGAVWRCEPCDYDLCQRCLDAVDLSPRGLLARTVRDGEFLPLVGTAITVTVVGCMQEVQVEQRFVNTFNEAAVDLRYNVPVDLGEVHLLSLEIETDRIISVGSTGWRGGGSGKRLSQSGSTEVFTTAAAAGERKIAEAAHPPLTTIHVGLVQPGHDVTVRLCYAVTLGSAIVGTLDGGSDDDAAITSIPIRIPASLCTGVGGEGRGIQWPRQNRSRGSRGSGGRSGGSGGGRSNGGVVGAGGAGANTLEGLHVSVLIHAIGTVQRVSCGTHVDEVAVHHRPRRTVRTTSTAAQPDAWASMTRSYDSSGEHLLRRDLHLTLQVRRDATSDRHFWMSRVGGAATLSQAPRPGVCRGTGVAGRSSDEHWAALVCFDTRSIDRIKNMSVDWGHIGAELIGPTGDEAATWVGPYICFAALLCPRGGEDPGTVALNMDLHRGTASLVFPVDPPPSNSETTLPLQQPVTVDLPDNTNAQPNGPAPKQLPSLWSDLVPGVEPEGGSLGEGGGEGDKEGEGEGDGEPGFDRSGWVESTLGLHALASRLAFNDLLSTNTRTQTCTPAAVETLDHLASRFCLGDLDVVPQQQSSEGKVPPQTLHVKSTHLAAHGPDSNDLPGSPTLVEGRTSYSSAGGYDERPITPRRVEADEAKCSSVAAVPGISLTIDTS